MLGILASTLEAHQVADNRMAPTLQVGQIVLISRLPTWLGEFRRGEVVLVKDDNGAAYFSRVFALPNENVLLEGSRITAYDPLLSPVSTSGLLPFALQTLEQRTLGADEYFLLDDNALALHTSGSFGSADAAQIQGRAWLVVWPLSAVRFIEHRPPAQPQ